MMISTKWLYLAALNVFRHRRRTLMAAVIIASGAASILTAFGYMLATFWGLGEVTIRGELGHLQIARPGSFDQPEEIPLFYGLEKQQVDQLTADIANLPEARNTLKRVMFEGLISTDNKTVVFIAQAVEPEKELRLAGFALPMASGKPLPATSSDEDPMQVLLAVDLARNLQAKVGDTLTILSTTVHGALNGIDVTVSGIYQTGVPEMDKRALMVPLSVARHLLQSDKISRLIVHLEETELTQKIREDLSARYSDLEIRSWTSLAPFYSKVVTLYKGIFIVMGVIILLVVLLSVTNTMLMSVMERVREVGTMRAFGTSRLRIRLIFWLEGTITGALGGIFGLIISAFIAVVINDLNIMLPPPPGRTMDIPLLIFIDAGLYGGVFVLMAVLGGLAAWFPARYITRLGIVEALGHD